MWLNNIPLYVGTTSSLSIHLLLDAGCFQILAIVNTAAMYMGVKYLLESLLSVVWRVHLEVELLGHRVVILCSTS